MDDHRHVGTGECRAGGRGVRAATQQRLDTTITTHIEDAAASGPADGTITLDVTPVADAPTATNLAQTKTYTEDDPTVALDDIVVTEFDTGDTITATLTLNNPADRRADHVGHGDLHGRDRRVDHYRHASAT